MEQDHKPPFHREAARAFPQGTAPDPNSPEFAAEARRQSLAVSQSEQAAADQQFVDAISWLGIGR